MISSASSSSYLFTSLLLLSTALLQEQMQCVAMSMTRVATNVCRDALEGLKEDVNLSEEALLQEQVVVQAWHQQAR